MAPDRRTLILVKVKSHLTKIIRLLCTRKRQSRSHLQKHFEKWPRLLSAIADTLREYCSALSTRGQGAITPADRMPTPVDNAAECHVVNPYFAWPAGRLMEEHDILGCHFPQASAALDRRTQMVPRPGRTTHHVGRTSNFIPHVLGCDCPLRIPGTDIFT